MNIILQWDPSVASLPSSTQVAFEAAVTFVADYYDRVLTSPYTVTINVGWGEITDNGQMTTLTSGTSEGGPGTGYDYSYSDLVTALQSHENSPETAAAYAALPTTDPSGGKKFFLTILEAESLGLPVYGDASEAAGSIGFGPPAAGDSYNFSTTDRAIPNEDDFVGIVLHEMAHALGRISDVGDGGALSVLDLFRFTGPGVLATSSSQTSYFSIDGGNIALKYFDSTNSDPADWMSSGPNASSGDSFDAYYQDDVEDFLTSADLDVLNLLGYSISPDVPGDDFNGNEVSDLLVQNTSGAVVVGELEPTGQATYTTVASLGPEWKFVGAGDFLGDGNSDFLIENTSGSVVVGEVADGAAQYTAVAGLGPEWSFRGAGDFLGDGKADFLIENAAGAVVVGEVVNGAAAYTQVAGLGPEWKFVGAGDFLGDGKADFLIENTAGAVVVGEVVNGAAQYTQVAALGPEWKFVESGDFLGDGKTDFLIENTAGAVVVGEVANGAAQYTQVAGLGPEWHFVGEGDYAGAGTDSFVIENIAGAVYTGMVVNGQAQFSQIAALGPEWSFHG